MLIHRPHPLTYSLPKKQKTSPHQIILSTWKEHRIAGSLLALTFLVLSLQLGQPILENYVGRQIPTAMVARNLARGSGFLHPQIDTKPSPNYFLVEPPIFAQLTAWVHQITGLTIGSSGRLVSALGSILTAWGIYRLARRREGTAVALISIIAFALFPITLRYGRACQPEMLMLGLMTTGLALLDAPRSRWATAAGICLVAIGLAVKVTGCYLLIPLGVVILADRPNWRRFLPLLFIPALLWYAYAGTLLRGTHGSLASAENGEIWLSSLIPSALLKAAKLGNFARYLFVRGFTPLGFVLGFWGVFRADRLYRIWGLAALAMLGGLAAKAHHEYYWISLAPVLAVGIGRALVDLGQRSQGGVALLFGLFVFLSVMQAGSAWRTPGQWSAAPIASVEINTRIPAGKPLIAPEALIYLADRQGYRLEVGQTAQERAAREWGDEPIHAQDPIALVEFYRDHGAEYFADLSDLSDTRRTALHQSIRERFTIWFDESGVLIAKLDRPREPSHAECDPVDHAP